MATFAVVVNGAPASGKTTLSRILRAELDLPLVAKDAVKEALVEAVGAPLPTRDLGGLSQDVVWRVVGMIDGPVLVESFWGTGRDEEFFARGLKVAGVTSGVEIWCEAPLEVLRERFTTRPRHAVHDDANRMPEWEASARTARPISGFPVIRVDTTGPVDTAQLAAELRTMIPTPPDGQQHSA
ncbi:hypothetical protein AX769_12715 [Frondihabitans sp. PAMC 28766]|uniref:AAA family ATPase n=1 Tax=Frondihabitans sp. PAMC 28766 TaxID=1795630 RepID=UPI00078C5867|nr:AAA family ATPase [Frondihabitans sp. PAMC 28766]AMM20846.1 hypothetical protein AX769_12715 [Frondihabitans sp. PAMC 28766]